MNEDQVIDLEAGDDELAHDIGNIIMSYTADITVKRMMEMLDHFEVFIPRIRRESEWTDVQSSRFIESFILNFPVPDFFLYEVPETKRLMVASGRNRLLALQSFYKGEFRASTFKLVGVHQEIMHETYDTLAPQLQRRLDESMIHAVIFYQIEPHKDRQSVFEVFERLNTAESQLSRQEIRSCIYEGGLTKLLSDLAKNSHFRHLFGMASAKQKDEEIILRFLAFRFRQLKYKPPMKRFLNDFMEEFCNPLEERLQDFRVTFEKTIEVAGAILPPNAFHPERILSFSTIDAVLVGLSHRLECADVRDHDALKAKTEELLIQLNEELKYPLKTTRKERFNRRIGFARMAYKEVQ